MMMKGLKIAERGGSMRKVVLMMLGVLFMPVGCSGKMSLTW